MNAATEATPAIPQDGIPPPPAYKSSELGIIPVDWRVLDIGDLRPFVTSGSRGWARYYSDLGAPFLRITNMSRESIYLDISDLKLVDLPTGQSEANRTHLKDGDVLISITADIGSVGYVDERISKPAYINQHIALVRFGTTETDSKFVSYLLASDAPQRVFRGLTDQGAKAGMSLLTVRKLKVLQPQIEEQRTIGTALSDVDGLIGALDKLIAKKRAIKLAAMQQLLTGKIRLRGFACEWTRRKVSDFGNIITGGTPRTSVGEYWNGDIPWVTPTDILGQKDIYSTERALTTTGLRAIRSLPKNSVLVTCIASIGKNAILRRDGGCNQQINAIVPNAAHSPDFLYYLMEHNKPVLLGNAGMTATSILSKKTFSELEFAVPQTHEQCAIANVLSDMDADITALERRRDKTKAIKRGMMQNLLTGRTRLV
jgi:type I restriction enzyme S subunit